MCCLAAAAMPLSAKTVTFKTEMGSYQPASADEEIVNVPMTWTGGTLYCDALNLYIGAGSKTSAGGGFYVTNTGTEKKNVAKNEGNLYLNFYPTDGIVIKKIIVRRSGSFTTNFLDMTYNEADNTFVWEGEVTGQSNLKNTKKFYLDYVQDIVDGVDKTDHTKERMRIRSISVEYEGTTTRTHMPKLSIGGNYVTNDPVVLTNDEPSAKIYYSISGTTVFKNQEMDRTNDEGFTEYDGTPIVVSQPSRLQAYAYEEGKWKSGLIDRWIIPGPEGSHQATFDFTNPKEWNLELEQYPTEDIGYALVDAKDFSKNIEFKKNGIIFKNTTTASKATNSIRLMSTKAYCHAWEIRHSSNNGKNNNKMMFFTENPENTICSIVLVGSMVNGIFSAAQKEKTAEGDVDFVFPDVVDYVDEASNNYYTKIFKQFHSSSAGKYVAVWTPSNDYEGEAEQNKVIFDMFSDANNSQISKIHVFYYGDSTEPSGIQGIAADNDSDAPVEFYNLQGMKVSGNEPGLYIRRQGSKVNKVIVR